MNLDRWLNLMRAWNFGRNEETYQALVASYAGKGRHYHTHEHVDACLRHLDTCLGQIHKPREVELALWFHDAIYKPLSSGNEKESADWAASFLSVNGATAEEAARVHRLIMVTEHNAPTSTNDESLLVDIDLSILGATPETYGVFELGVRKEYRLVPPFIYRKKRAEVLRGFLDRPRIYENEPFASTRERQARMNLGNAIATLAAQGSLRIPAITALAALALELAHLYLEHAAGGVQSHHLMNRADLPAISNWLGLVIVPALGWALGMRLRNKWGSGVSGIAVAGVAMLLYGAALAVSFEWDYSSVTSGLFMGLFALAVLLPLYRAEYLLGFVAGMALTFGAVLPAIVVSVFALISLLVRSVVGAGVRFVTRSRNVDGAA